MVLSFWALPARRLACPAGQETDTARRERHEHVAVHAPASWRVPAYELEDPAAAACSCTALQRVTRLLPRRPPRVCQDSQATAVIRSSAWAIPHGPPARRTCRAAAFVACCGGQETRASGRGGGGGGGSENARRRRKKTLARNFMDDVIGRPSLNSDAAPTSTHHASTSSTVYIMVFRLYRDCPSCNHAAVQSRYRTTASRFYSSKRASAYGPSAAALTATMSRRQNGDRHVGHCDTLLIHRSGRRGSSCDRCQRPKLAMAQRIENVRPSSRVRGCIAGPPGGGVDAPVQAPHGPAKALVAAARLAAVGRRAAMALAQQAHVGAHLHAAHALVVVVADGVRRRQRRQAAGARRVGADLRSHRPRLAPRSESVHDRDGSAPLARSDVPRGAARRGTARRAFGAQ